MGAAARTVRPPRRGGSIRIGAILVLASLALAGCASGPAKTAGRETSPPERGLIQPPGPISAHPALLDEASAACQRARAPDITLCAGTVDAEAWGLPLVITSDLRDSIACLIGVNVLDTTTKLDGPGSTAVPTRTTTRSTRPRSSTFAPDLSYSAFPRCADATSISSCWTCTPTPSLT
jgi:hypothetical protein